MGLDCLQLVEAPVQLLQGLEGHPQESLVRHVRRVKGRVRLKEEIKVHPLVRFSLGPHTSD